MSAPLNEAEFYELLGHLFTQASDCDDRVRALFEHIDPAQRTLTTEQFVSRLGVWREQLLVQTRTAFDEQGVAPQLATWAEEILNLGLAHGFSAGFQAYPLTVRQQPLQKSPWWRSLLPRRQRRP